MRVILAPDTTDTVQSAEFAVSQGFEVTLLLYPEANLGADTATLQIKAPDGTFVVVTDKDGDVVLSDTRRAVTIVGVGVYRVDVPARISAWGVQHTS